MTTTPATVPPETSSTLPETDAVTCARAGLAIPPAQDHGKKKTLDMPPATLEHATFTLPVIHELAGKLRVRFKEIALIPAGPVAFSPIPLDLWKRQGILQGSQIGAQLFERSAAFLGRDASNRPPRTVINSVTCSVSAGLGNNPQVGLRNSLPVERWRALAPFNSLA